MFSTRCGHGLPISGGSAKNYQAFHSNSVSRPRRLPPPEKIPDLTLFQRTAKAGQPQREDLVEGLSTLFIDERVMYYVEWYGFYEGHTEWRADPIAIAFILGMKDPGEIDTAFDGRLYDASTEHSTR